MTAKVAIQLSGTIGELFEAVSQVTNMPAADIVRKLLLAHVSELHEYLSYMQQLPERPTQAQRLAPWAIHNYGPVDLVQTIKGFDPTYRTEAERFIKEITT